MKTVIITGSGGLIGSYASRFFVEKGFRVVGIDNDTRSVLFGEKASVKPTIERLKELKGYEHMSLDIREITTALMDVFDRAEELAGVIHCAAQPSHDWATLKPMDDFYINVVGTKNILYLTKIYNPEAVFVHLSTNKVYGDQPNQLSYIEDSRRFVPNRNNNKYTVGIDETMSIDQCLHSVFGANKAAADIIVQEYGRYYGMNTVCFRGGCLTGSGHAGAEQHGFLSYLIKRAVQGQPYTIYGYGGKQVRDNIHAQDVVSAIWEYFQKPRPGEVYNIGGGWKSNCSVLEAIEMIEDVAGVKMTVTHDEKERKGDHKWYITNMDKFKSHYPNWKQKWGIVDIINDIYIYEKELKNGN